MPPHAPQDTSDTSADRLRQTLTALNDLDERHRERMAMLESLAKTELRLRTELHRERPALGFWSRLKARWSPPPTAAAETLAQRHEAMVRAVRDLGFHLLALHGAVTAVTQDQAAVLELCGAPALGPTQATTQQTLAERALALSDLLAVEHEVLSTRQSGLEELHAVSQKVAHALSRQALQQHLSGPRNTHAPALDGVILQAIQQAAELHHRVDSLEARMRQLDDDARQRRQADAEVNTWLSD